MQKERRYKISMMNGKEYQIDESDLAKLKDNADEMLVQLKQVIVHPASVVAIEPHFIDFVRKAVPNPMGGMSICDQQVPPKAIPDMFGNEILKLTEGKQI